MKNKKLETPLKILGMMSGTSCDGIDGALVEINPNWSYRLLWHDSMPFNKKVKNRLLKLCDDCSALEALLGHRYVAELYSDAVNLFLSRNRPRPDAIAAHGQTILHHPQQSIWEEKTVNGSLQLLNGSVLAFNTQAPVICNFREADLAAGGAGAPLVPFADAKLFADSNSRIILNIGGIANLTILKGSQVLKAFDTGPGNMLMDAFIHKMTDGNKSFDHNGNLAAQGHSSPEVLASVLKNPWFGRKPPKTTGRKDFGAKKLAEIEKMFCADSEAADIMSTLLDITVESIGDAVQLCEDELKLPCEMVVAGGGAKNHELLIRLQKKLHNKCILVKSDRFGIPESIREAVCFAFLGAAFLYNTPSNCPNATGAKKEVVLGQLHPAN